MNSSVARAVQPLRRTRRDLQRVGGLVAAYVALRLLGLWMLNSSVTGNRPDGGFGTPDPPTTLDKLAAWDGGWYVKIAEGWYPDHLSLTSPRDDSTAPLAFPPLYPGAMRLLHLIGVPAVNAGLLITAIAGIAAVIGVYAVARDVISPRASMIAALLWAAGPMTIVLSMVYSEALFVALAAWAIWLARRGWWLCAGLLGLLAGLTRSTGLAVGVAIAVAAYIAWRAADAGNAGSALSSDCAVGVRRWRLVAGSLLALAGVPLWWLYVAIVSGRADGWFAAQQFFWGSRFDLGASSVRNVVDSFGFGSDLDAMARFVYTGAAVAMLIAVLLAISLVAHAWRTRQPREWWPLAAYAVVLVVLAVGSAGYQQSKIRFVVPMFVLFLLPTRRLATLSRATRMGVVALMVLVGAWFSTFMLTVWPYAI